MMSRQPQSRPNRLAPWRYPLLVSLPPLLVASLFIVGLIREHQASESVQAAIRDLDSQQRPATIAYGINLLSDPVDVRDQDESWILYNRAADEVTTRIDEFARLDTDQDLWVAPGDDWPGYAVIKNILADSQPIIDEIVTLIDAGQSEPNDDSFAELLLQNLRIAFYDNDPELAMTMLQTIHRLANRTNLTSQNFRRLRNTQYNAIAASLEFGFWQTSEQTEELREMVARPILLPASWNAFVDRHRRLTIAKIDLTNRHISASDYTNREAFGLPAVAQERWIRQFDKLESHVGTDLIEHYFQVRGINHDDSAGNQSPGSGLSNMTLMGMPYADLRRYDSDGFYHHVERQLSELAQLEYQRYVTGTLIAIKQFQQQEKRWPTNLVELSVVGLQSESWAKGIESLLKIKAFEDGEPAELVRPSNLNYAIIQVVARRRHKETQQSAFLETDRVK